MKYAQFLKAYLMVHTEIHFDFLVTSKRCPTKELLVSQQKIYLNFLLQ